MKTLVILNLKNKNILNDNLLKIIQNANNILSLTPYSSYILDDINKNHIEFHDLISMNEFKQVNLDIYFSLINDLKKYKYYYYLLSKIMTIVTYQTYIDVINQYIILLRNTGCKIIYITDEQNIYLNIDKEYVVDKRNTIFYKKNKIINIISTIAYRKKLFSATINKILKKNISYDAIHYAHLFKKCKIKRLMPNNIEKFIMELKKVLKKYNRDNLFFEKFYDEISVSYSKLLMNKNNELMENKPFTYITEHIENIKARILKINNCKVVFFQHGSYLYSGEHSEWAELYPASINFVCNDFTKKLFLSRGAKEVYSVGSENFNFRTKIIKHDYDYLYITYCADYEYIKQKYSRLSYNLSMNGNQDYLRHKAIIELFGNKFKDKKICIKIQPGIFLGTMMYVPFLELSKNYPNITIEFSVPIQKLILKSKYIISDYFSSEFINRELHYTKDIILFKSIPLPLPEKTVSDMQKMFILIDTIDELEDKVMNIEDITKNRKRYDDIIEYYSSKKCNTKKVITEILKKELHGG